jgi:hypothetical protein
MLIYFCRNTVIDNSEWMLLKEGIKIGEIEAVDEEVL